MAVRVNAQLYMTPDSATGSPRAAILDMLTNAKHTVDFGIYAFTTVQIADAIIAAKKRGVKVRGVMDAGQAVTERNRYQYLKDAGVDVRLWGGGGQLLHDKVLLVDGVYPRLARFGLGSYNWTEGGESVNREVWLVTSGTAVAKSFAPALLHQLGEAYAAGR